MVLGSPHGSTVPAAAFPTEPQATGYLALFYQGGGEVYAGPVAYPTVPLTGKSG